MLRNKKTILRISAFGFFLIQTISQAHCTQIHHFMYTSNHPVMASHPEHSSHPTSLVQHSITGIVNEIKSGKMSVSNLNKLPVELRKMIEAHPEYSSHPIHASHSLHTINPEYASHPQNASHPVHASHLVHASYPGYASH